jgi:YVTN family beta-propeller protein
MPLSSRPRLAPIALLAIGAGFGCGLSQEGVPPPTDRFFFPGAASVDPSGHLLYVANSNADLRFNDGTLVSVDLDAAEADRNQPWGACPEVAFIPPLEPVSNERFCCWDLLDNNVLDCDERPYIQAAATVKIGSFASAMVQQPAPLPATGVAPGADLRLFLAVRGNSSITFVDVVPTDAAHTSVAFDCTSGASQPPFAECDVNHQITTLEDQPPAAPVVTLPEEPYALAIEPDNALLYVGHLSGNVVSLIDVLNQPAFIGAFSGFFPDVNGQIGITSLLVRQDANPAKRVYASSRFVPQATSIQAVLPDGQQGPPPPLVDRAAFQAFPSGDTFATGLAGSEIRGVQFPLPGQAFLLQRTPPALVGFNTDTSNGVNTVSSVTELCDSPTFLDMYAPAGAPTRLFVTCFQSGQVYVIDPAVPRVEAIIEVGRGPGGLTFSPQQPRAYVTGFGANNVSIIDLEPGSPTELHVIQTIGFQSATPR